MAETKKTKRVRQSGIKDGIATYKVYGPVQADGTQEVDRELTHAYADLHDDVIPTLALIGANSVFSNRYNRPRSEGEGEWTPDLIEAEFVKLRDAFRDGTWTPGRQFDEREPTDLELAVAEATGQDVADVMRDFEERVHLNADGTPKLDARGRKQRVFTKSVQEKLADDPALRPILARLADERAKRLRAAAKGADASQSALSSMFTVAPHQEAAQ